MTPVRGRGAPGPEVARPLLGRRRSLYALAVFLVGLALVSCGSRPEETPPEQIERSLKLVSVTYDQEALAADTNLAQHLASKIKEYMEEELDGKRQFSIDLERHTYESAWARVVDPDADSSYVARLTPYVYVVAELLGAEFEVVGTYRSEAVLNSLSEEEREDESTAFTYRCYFVVNRERMGLGPPGEGREPGLLAFEEYLRSFPRNEPPTFAYHNKFSTSSFFLPSVYFRRRGIIDMESAPEDSSVIRIEAEDIAQGDQVSSKRLVERVAEGGAELAAVWDGAKAHFESGAAFEEYGKHVAFIPLDQPLPNDLLVVSSSVSPRIREWIRRAIERESMDADDIKNDADFLYWRPIDTRDTRKARSALAGLRQLARAQIAPVTVKVETVDDSTQNPAAAAELRTIRQAAEDALRLSGSELVLWSEFYANYDFVWNLRPIHDGAVVLRSSVEGLPRWDQEFEISYKNPRDLTERIGDLIRGRMHRLRHVWPYSKSSAPTILRDVDFSVDEGETIQVQKIVWANQETNAFVIKERFEAPVVHADSRRFELSGERFGDDLHAMGSISYRAVLPRPSEERPLFTILTVVLILLFLGAGVAAAVELRRPAAVPAESAPRDLIGEAFRGSVERFHGPWRNGASREIAEADLIGQDRDAIEVLIAELMEAEGTWWTQVLDRLRFAREDSGEDVRRLTRDLLIQREKIGGTRRLADLIEYLIRRDLLSSFTGTSLEFEAWNRATCELFSHAVPGQDGSPEKSLQVLDPDGASVARLVTTHFDEVLKEARSALSLFPKVWSTRKDPSSGRSEDRLIHRRWIFSYRERLPVALDVGCLGLDRGAAERDLVRHLLIEFKLSPPVNLTIVEGQDIDAWMLGILDRYPSVIASDDGETYLRLHFKALALLRGPAC
ncbi:MAG: hypothetical protein ACE5EG_00215 [Thermoanaerobaculia bacterium]